MLMNTVSEFAQQDPGISSRGTRGFTGVRAILQQAVQRGQQEGEIAPEPESARSGRPLRSLCGPCGDSFVKHADRKVHNC